MKAEPKEKIKWTRWTKQFAWIPTQVGDQTVFMKSYEYRCGWPVPFQGYIYDEKRLIEAGNE